MSDQNKINVQPVLDTKSIQEQLNRQKYKINVDVDTSQIISQIQSTISQATNNVKPAKIPIEINADNIFNGISQFNTGYLGYQNIGKIGESLQKNLD